MKKLLFVAAVLTLSACAGRLGNPVTITQADDKARPCAVLKKEIEQIRPEIAKLEPEAKAIYASNQEIRTSWMSWILILPLYPYDTMQGQQVELDAYKSRMKHLELISAEKSCT